MKKLIEKITHFFRSHDVAFYASLIGPFLMGTFHLIFIIIEFDWILVNYCIFFYLMSIFKAWQWLIDKYQLKVNHYVAGLISILIILAPMMAAFVLTIMYKDAPHYIYDWFVYGYALYGTIKMVIAVKGLMKKDKNEKKYIVSYLNMIGTLYTVQMMEFALVATFSEGFDYGLYILQLYTQGAIFLFSLFVIGLFIYRLVKKKETNTSLE